MNKIIILVISLGFLFASCRELPTDSDFDRRGSDSPVGLAVAPPDDGDDDDDDNGCEITDQAMLDFIDEIEAQFTESELEEIEEALGEPLSCSLFACFEENFNNHGGFVSCISHWTNGLKKQKLIKGKQKGIIVNIAARSDVGK